MEQSQLIELIKVLSPIERGQMLEFASMRFFNNGNMKLHVLPLLEICICHLNENGNNPLRKVDVYASVFPNQIYISGKLEKVMVEAHKMVRAFLLFQCYFEETNDFQQDIDFAEILRFRGLAARHRHILSKLQKKQEENQWKNAEYYYRQYQLEMAIHNKEAYNNQMKGDLKTSDALWALEQYYHIRQYAHLNALLLQKKVAMVPIPEFISSLLQKQLLPDYLLKASPDLLIRALVFQILMKDLPDTSDAQHLFDSLLQNEHLLDTNSLREHYTYLRNVCALISNANFENMEIRQTTFDLYKDNLIRGYLHYEGRLHPNTYRAVAVAALIVGQPEWALNFIETYKNDLIGGSEIEDMYRFNKALYYFSIKQYEKCMDNIPDNLSNVDYMMHAMRLTLQVLYETRSDLLHYRIDNTKMHLSRTSPKLLSESNRKLNLEFVNLLAQIVKSIQGDRKRSELLVKRIQERKGAFEWRWLLTKAKELANRPQ